MIFVCLKASVSPSEKRFRFVRYKPVGVRKDEVGRKCAVINHDDSVFTHYLKHKEIIIQQLTARQCPAGRNCIEYRRKDQAVRLCEHFKNFFQLTDNRFFYKGLFCNQTKSYQKVSVLRPLDCPDSRNSCIGCDRLVNIIGIPYPEKSRSHLVCREI